MSGASFVQTLLDLVLEENDFGLNTFDELTSYIFISESKELNVCMRINVNKKKSADGATSCQQGAPQQPDCLR